MLLRLFAIAFAFVSASVSAQELRNPVSTPQDFSWQWPLSVQANEDLQRLTLTPEVYERLWRDDVLDLVIFNGQDEVVPVSPLNSLLSVGGGSQLKASLTPINLPLFRLPTSRAPIAERLRLVVDQGQDGQLRRLEADLETVEPPHSNELLLDLSLVSSPVRGLWLEFAPDAGPLVARVDVFSSRDLSKWQRIAAGQAVVRLDEGGLTLERRFVEFADTDAPYLRMVRTDSKDPLPIASMRAFRSRNPQALEQPLEKIVLVGHTESRTQGFLYLTEGPFPIERVEVKLAERNAAASVVIESRTRSDLPWRERARGAVFHIASNTTPVESAPFDISPTRDREWRIRTDPPQAKIPALTVYYRADQFAFLPQGEGPFRLAVGSARNERNNYPLQAVFLGIRQQRGEQWLPPEARLGRGAELAGSSALAPRRDNSGSPTPWQWLLWLVLLVAAFSVVSMVLKLVRQVSE